MSNMDLVAVPSDRLSMFLHTYNEKLAVNGESITVITPINMTNIYNWYIDNIERHFNKLALQRVTLLFKFIIEQYLLQLADNMFFYYAEGFISSELHNLNDETYLPQLLNDFIANNGIPYDKDIVNFFNQCITDGRMDTLSKMLLDTLAKHNLKITPPSKAMDLEIDWYNTPILNLPIRWNDIILDPATHLTSDIFEYGKAYPFDVKLTLYIATVPLVINGFVNIESYNEIVSLCTQPLQLDRSEDVL